jgi:hypothetical protein
MGPARSSFLLPCMTKHEVLVKDPADFMPLVPARRKKPGELFTWDCMYVSPFAAVTEAQADANAVESRAAGGLNGDGAAGTCRCFTFLYGTGKSAKQYSELTKPSKPRLIKDQ